MKDTVIDIIKGIIGIAFLVAIVLGIYKCDAEQDKAKWNKGYCECGGHWEYEQAVGHRYTTSYVYRCDKCGRFIEFQEPMIKEEENDIR